MYIIHVHVYAYKVSFHAVKLMTERERKVVILLAIQYSVLTSVLHNTHVHVPVAMSVTI